MSNWNNVGTIDKAARTIVGLGLIAIVFVGPQTPWGWIGIIPLATVALNWCPLYTLLGISTKTADKEEQPQN